ncbi:MAG: PAS domain-containing protein [Cytophagales bacterium]|nr:PAS domain-containing protein [Armatimonadota bacterium]
MSASQSAYRRPVLSKAAEKREAASAEQNCLRAALAEAQTRLDSVSKLFPVTRFAINAEETLLTLEGQGVTLLGLRPEKFIGRPVRAVLGRGSVALMHLRRALKGEEVRWAQEVGGYIWEIRCVPMRRGDGSLIGVDGIALNVTEKRNSEIEARWRGREIAALNAILAEVSSVLDLPDVLASVRRQLVQQLLIPGGVLYLLDFSRFHLERSGFWGVPPELLQRVDVLVAELFAASGELYAARGIDGLFPEGRGTSLWQAGYCIPLLVSDQLLGVLVLFSHEMMGLRKHRPAFYDTLGRQIGTALQNARLFSELRSGREQLQALNRRLVEVQEAERLRLARELHDEIGQIVTGLKMTIDLTARETVDRASVQPFHEESKRLVRDLMERVRQMSLDLRPTMLDDLGLLPALLWHFERYTLQTGIVVRFQHGGVERRRLGDPIETAVYRLIQEALTNVARHAGGVPEVSVLLQVAGESLDLWIEDRGAGFSPNQQSAYASSGLSGMRERAGALNGSLTLSSTPGQGTTVAVQIPLSSADGPIEYGGALY